MKTILRIIIILLVASIVAGGFSLAVNHGATTSNSNGQPFSINNNNGQSFQPMVRPEAGDHDGGGIAGAFGTLAKITGITILVLAIQKAFRLFGDRKPIITQQ